MGRPRCPVRPQAGHPRRTPAAPSRGRQDQHRSERWADLAGARAGHRGATRGAAAQPLGDREPPALSTRLHIRRRPLPRVCLRLAAQSRLSDQHGHPYHPRPAPIPLRARGQPPFQSTPAGASRLAAVCALAPAHATARPACRATPAEASWHRWVGTGQHPVAGAANSGSAASGQALRAPSKGPQSHEQGLGPIRRVTSRPKCVPGPVALAGKFCDLS